MSIGHEIPLESTLGHLPLPPVQASSDKKPLHRIADVRRRQGISVRSAARRMHTSIDQVRRQEEPANDMLLSELLRWQRALDVPLADFVRIFRTFDCESHEPALKGNNAVQKS